VHDAVAALLLCNAGSVEFSVINGRQVVMDGKLLTVDVESWWSGTTRLRLRSCRNTLYLSVSNWCSSRDQIQRN